MKTATRTNVITIEEARRRDRVIPKAWLDVIGILKGKRKISALAYQRKIRAEWNRSLGKKTRRK